MIAGGVEISTLSRRNLNLRVSRREGPGWLVKQADPLRTGGARTLARELELYEVFARESVAEPLRELIPRARLLRRDPPLFAVEWKAGARSPWRVYRDSPAERFPCTPAADLGAALGLLHATFDGRARDAGSGLSRLPRRPADFLSVHLPAPHELRRMSAAQVEISRLIQSEPAIGAGLDRARSDWRPQTLLHGDVRSANLLVLPPSTERDGGVVLIDWELAKWGDPAWDLGCAMADLVHFWVRGMPRDAALPPERRAAQARVPLSAIQPAFAALWSAYRSAPGSAASAEREGDLLLRAVRCSAARLIQAAWQRCSGVASVAVSERSLLQIAANVLSDPAGAGRTLYSLAASSSGTSSSAEKRGERRGEKRGEKRGESPA
ncbi:MAG TPA: phosphotransferase [Thermoanaerobaculia bacterium]|nr:phosphotransferase [Thermoanaerobaculia bacterium]